MSADRVGSDILARCTKCGHSSTLFVDDAVAADNLKRAMDGRIMRSLLKMFWRGWTLSFALGICFGWFAWRLWLWL